MTVVSKKFTVDADISCVNLMDIIALFQTRKMSSMNHIQSIWYWDHSVLYTYISLKCPTYRFAKLGATLVPIAVLFTCRKVSSLNVKLFIFSNCSKMAANILDDGLFCPVVVLV